MSLSKVLLSLVLCSPCYALDEASRAALEAFYKQAGGEAMADRVVKEYIPKAVRTTAEQVYPVISAVVNKKVELKWTF